MFKNKIDNNQGLNLFFEDGKAKLYWKGLELTKNLGLHSAFNIDEKWHISSEGQWLVSEIAPGKFQISINYTDIGVIQSWLLTLAGNDELLWEVDMQVKQPVYILDRKVGLFLSDNYAHWFHFSDQGKFPQAFNWDDVPLKKHIFLNKIGSCSFGVMPSVTYPGILFEVDAQGTPLLQNTNEEIKARAVQFQLNGINQNNYYETGMYKWCFGKIKLIENEGAANSHIENLREKIFTAKVFEHGKLKLYFDERKARLYWDDLELTKHFALNTIFSFNEKWYGSSYTDWQITRIDRERLHITIDYRDIPIVHKWVMTITADNELTWEVGMQIKKTVNIKHKKMGLFVLSEYKRWFNASEEGEFPESFNWENLFLNRTDSCGFGVKPVGGCPGILFEVDAEGIPLIQNTSKEFCARALQFELADDAQSGYYEPGYYKWGSGRIKIIEDKAVIDRYIENEREKLILAKSFGSDKLRLFFDEGEAKILWNELELTKGIGMHIALNVNGNWYDSLHAEWQFKKLSQEKIYINVRYRDIPVEQKWTLSLTGEEELVWDVDIQVKETLQIPHKKISLFLSDKYTHWFNSSEEGEFPRGFNWERIFLNQIDSRGFGVKPAGDYPGILFEVNVEGAPLIQNTNEQLKGRAVQFELSDGKDNIQYAPGNTYKLFSGKIRLIEDEKIINDYMASRQLLPLELLDSKSLYIF
ncbi:MAG: hypothetical protein Q8N62_04190, partial [Candidatus Omnitrophota bacterium]|nr:hypothetical protein [Candidatus Omnitrophota bacterium]